MTWHDIDRLSQFLGWWLTQKKELAGKREKKTKLATPCRTSLPRLKTSVTCQLLHLSGSPQQLVPVDQQIWSSAGTSQGVNG